MTGVPQQRLSAEGRKVLEGLYADLLHEEKVHDAASLEGDREHRNEERYAAALSRARAGLLARQLWPEDVAS